MSFLSHDEIARLSPNERLTLIGDLWASLADDDVALSEPHKAELKRRLASFEDDKDHAVSWEELKANALR